MKTTYSKSPQFTDSNHTNFKILSQNFLPHEIYNSTKPPTSHNLSPPLNSIPDPIPFNTDLSLQQNTNDNINFDYSTSTLNFSQQTQSDLPFNSKMPPHNQYTDETSNHNYILSSIPSNNPSCFINLKRTFASSKKKHYYTSCFYFDPQTNSSFSKKFSNSTFVLKYKTNKTSTDVSSDTTPSSLHPQSNHSINASLINFDPQIIPSQNLTFSMEPQQSRGIQSVPNYCISCPNITVQTLNHFTINLPNFGSTLKSSNSRNPKYSANYDRCNILTFSDASQSIDSIISNHKVNSNDQESQKRSNFIQDHLPTSVELTHFQTKNDSGNPHDTSQPTISCSTTLLSNQTAIQINDNDTHPSLPVKNPKSPQLDSQIYQSFNQISSCPTKNNLLHINSIFNPNESLTCNSLIQSQLNRISESNNIQTQTEHQTVSCNYPTFSENSFTSHNSILNIITNDNNKDESSQNNAINTNHLNTVCNPQQILQNTSQPSVQFPTDSNINNLSPINSEFITCNSSNASPLTNLHPIETTSSNPIHIQSKQDTSDCNNLNFPDDNFTSFDLNDSFDSTNSEVEVSQINVPNICFSSDNSMSCSNNSFYCPSPSSEHLHTNSFQMSHNRRRVFTHVEDDIILQNIPESGKPDWFHIASLLTNRTPRQCRERYNLFLNTHIANSSWTKYEDSILLETYWHIGPRWYTIAQYLHPHDAVGIRNRCNKLLKYSLDENYDGSDLNSFKQYHTRFSECPKLKYKPHLFNDNPSFDLDPQNNTSHSPPFSSYRYSQPPSFPSSNHYSYPSSSLISTHPLSSSLNQQSSPLSDYCQPLTADTLTPQPTFNSHNFSFSVEDVAALDQTNHSQSSSDCSHTYNNPCSCSNHSDPINSESHFHNAFEPCNNQITVSSNFQTPIPMNPNDVTPPSSESLSVITPPLIPSNSQDIQSNIENTTDNSYNVFKDNLLICFNQPNDDIIIESLTSLYQSFTPTFKDDITLDSNIALLLFTSQIWPEPVLNKCFVKDCNYTAPSEGMLRVHLCNAHKFDSGIARDELIMIISYLLNKQIITTYDKEDGSVRIPEKQMLYCHFPNCGYATDRDFRVKTHRNHHKSFNEHINKLGRFWGFIKSWIDVNKYLPTIEEMLGQGEMWACKICDFISPISQNVKDHIGCTHKHLNTWEKNDTLVPIFLKFILGTAPLFPNMIHNFTNSLDNSVTSTPSQNVITCSSLDLDTPLEITTHTNMSSLSFDETCLNKFNDENLYTCKNDASSFSDLLRLAFSFEDEKFYMLLYKLKDAPTPKLLVDKPEFPLQESIAHFLCNTSPECWPPFSNAHNCCICGLNFNKKDDLIQHSYSHGEDCVNRITDELLGAIQNIIHDHIECRIILPNQSALVFNDSDCTCRVPGCSFVADSVDALMVHMDNRDDHNHTVYKSCCLKYGVFYGAIKAYLQIENKLPTPLSLLRGKISNNYACRICKKILAPTLNAVKNHFTSFHSDLSNIPFVDKVQSVRISYTSDAAPNNSNIVSSSLVNQIKSTTVNLLDSLNKEELSIACNKAYFKLLKEDNIDSDVPLTLSNKQIIDPHKIINKNTVSTKISSKSSSTPHIPSSSPKTCPISLKHSVDTDSMSTNSQSYHDPPSPSSFKDADVQTTNANLSQNSHHCELSDDYLYENDTLSDCTPLTLKFVHNDDECATEIFISSDDYEEDLHPGNSTHLISSSRTSIPDIVNDLFDDYSSADDHVPINHDDPPVSPHLTHSPPLNNSYISSDLHDIGNPPHNPTSQIQPSKPLYQPPKSIIRSSRHGGSGRSKFISNKLNQQSITLPVVGSNLHDTPKHDIKIQQGLKWFQEAKKRGVAHFPKLDRNKRKLVAVGLKDLFENELIPLLKEFDPRSITSDDTELKWTVFEGAYEEVMHRIRVHIACALNFDPVKIYKKSHHKKWLNKTYDELSAIQNDTKHLTKLKATLEHFNGLESKDDKQCSLLCSKIANCLSFIDDNVKCELFGTSIIHNILEEIFNCSNISKYSDWLSTKINDLIKQEANLKSKARHSKNIQESYSDNPKKTLDNFIFNIAKPNCQIDEHVLINHFTNTFKRNNIQFLPDENGIFNLIPCFNDEDRSLFMDHLSNIDVIKEVINSRKFNSAAGPDAIDYSIFKLVPNESSYLMQLIIEIIIHNRRVPSSWKESNMNLIYKKGDVSDPSNWRPICISNASYRIFSCICARSINFLNNQIQIFSPNQRGFIEKVNGCSDNASIISELYYDAMRNNKSLYITALDFRNAFGSVDHNMITHCLHEKGFPAEFCDIIANIYFGSSTKIITNRFTSPPIGVKRGTKQGCPVSPLLFNICLEPLFKAINLLNQKDGYSFIWNNKTVNFNVLAYADDLLLISDSRQGMSNILKTCEMFCNFSKMELAPNKCCSVGYIWTNNNRASLKQPFRIGDEFVPFVDIDTSIKYLGSPVAARKIVKLNSSEEFCNKFKVKALRIFESDLCIVQKLHAIKTFVFPTIDFILENGQLKIKDVTELDHFIAKHINILFQGNIPTAVKHASWKDGGLSIPSLRDKMETARIKSFIRMITNKDANISALAEKALEDERHKRKIDTTDKEEDMIFFNWKDYESDPHKGTNSIIQRCRLALKNLNLTLTRNTSNAVQTFDVDGCSVIDSSDENGQLILNDTLLDSSFMFSDSKKLSLFLTGLRRKVWAQKAAKQTFHLHSLYSFVNNPLSNSAIVNLSNPVSDHFIKFAIRSRVNIIGTPEFDEIIHNTNHVPCPLCSFTGTNSTQSLAHILNGCVKRYPLYTKRHNRVQNVIVEYLKDMARVEEIHCDKAITSINLPEHLKLLRPDISVWSDNRSYLKLIEISVPYATFNWGSDSLKASYDAKKQKYGELVQALRDLNIHVELFVIIVSSLGAVYDDSRLEINKLINDKKRAKTLIKRISANAIIGSLEIWRNFQPSPNRKSAPLHDSDKEELHSLPSSDSICSISDDG